MKEILFNEENNCSMYKQYLNNKERLSTITDVKFINATQLLIASFSGCFISIYDLTNDCIIDKHYTQFKKYKTPIDLIFLHNNIIYASHINANSIGIYKIINNKIFFDKHIDTKKYGNPHGIYCNGDIILYTTINTCSIIKINIQNENSLDDFTHFLIYRHTPKSQIQSVICFDSTIIACGTYASITSKINKDLMKSFIVVIHENTSETQYFEYDNCRFDGICIHNDVLFVCDQFNSKVCSFQIKNDNGVVQFEKINEITNMDFCHGVDYDGGKLAIACYGSNSVKIIDM